MKIEKDTLVKNALFKSQKYIYNGKEVEEIFVAGYDFGNRVYVVKWINNKSFIVKVSSCNVLCGARGMGMVMPFPTKYYLGEINDWVVPAGWTNWNGHLTFTHMMECGRQWKKGLIELEKLVKNE
jgi:hypothetical protein